ncbi:MAG: dNTP triphosphohydrolase [Ruminococcaceae bacterium]|nr:dNTP triphosphohydrolase [Oscillospiraceae bacterium]
MHWREIRIKQEEQLAPYATRSTKSLGRIIEEKPCEVRSAFERDANRILYSEDFRRLRHKTQVFFNAKNDHICTRMEHVLYVNSISNTIGRTLNLNQDLLAAIALGHDLGHAPFGHSGERALSKMLNEINPELSFHHENHSLRVADRLSKRISQEKIAGHCGLNLTYEVRDGIVSHCGENYEEFRLHADKTKKPEDIYTTDHRHCMPYTLEGCLVRLVDKIAYVGRDIEDAIRAQLIDYNDISKEVRNVLGSTNGEMINTLVKDLIENSFGKEEICLSEEKGLALRDMIYENNTNIYRSEMIIQYEKNANNTMVGLFKMLYSYTKEIWGEARAMTPVGTDPMTVPETALNSLMSVNSPAVKNRLISFILDKGYGIDEVPAEQIVADYIAGMTDAYALKTFEELYWI